MAQVIRNIHGEIVDPFHRTIPLLTKYERARVLGERARQLEEGAEPFVPVPAEVIDSYTIAEMELKEKAIPFIIERPLPHGGCEFWRLCDLEFV
jgi:DNA-directed RNA polymerase I, II, and III subunit RPABC2